MQLTLLEVLAGKVGCEEFKANDRQECQVESLCLDELTKELTNLLEVHDRCHGGLCLTCIVAPGEEFREVAGDGRLHEQVVYDLELCLRNLEIRIHGKLLQKGKSLVNFIMMRVLGTHEE